MQSTGLKDKNGNMINLGYSVFMNGNKYEVIKNDFNGRYALDNEQGQCWLSDYHLECEIPMVTVYLMKDFNDMDRSLFGKTTLSHVLADDIRAYQLPQESFGSDMDDMAICETMFEMLNIDHPDDYQNRSLSVGDVVAINRNNVENYYICASIGFTRLEA